MGLFGGSQALCALPSAARSAQAGRAREAEEARPGAFGRELAARPEFAVRRRGRCSAGFRAALGRPQEQRQGAESRPAVASERPGLLRAPQLPGCSEPLAAVWAQLGLESAGGEPEREKGGVGRGLRTEKAACRTMPGKWGRLDAPRCVRRFGRPRPPAGAPRFLFSLACM